MNDKQRNLGRVALYATVIGAMAISLIPAGVRSASAQGNTRSINNFDVSGRFLEVWSAQGNDQANTYVNGLPITARRLEMSTEDGKPADVNGTTKVWFQETRHSISGKILEYWNRYGGLQQFGFPLSEAFTENSTDGKPYTTQYFERARFEVHPEKAD